MPTSTHDVNTKLPLSTLNFQFLRYNDRMYPLKVMLVDDHEIVRVGMKTLLNQREELIVIAEAGSEDEAVVEAVRARPNVILMDIRLGSGSGIEACRRIIELQPETKIIMLTSYAEDEMLFSAIRAGAVGYVLKQTGSRTLVQAIVNAAEGIGTLDPTLTQKVFDEVRYALNHKSQQAFAELNKKELRVLLLLTQGATNQAIADELFLSKGTVRNYVSNILSKLHVANRAEAAAYAIEHGLQKYLEEA